MNEKYDVMRRLQELGMSYVKKHKSPQTGYLHYCYDLNQDEPYLPIPLLENFLVALTLLRSKTIENVNEAKEMLEKLLHFQVTNSQNNNQVNFPIYLHEYPQCKDRFLSVHIASVIYWILKLFHQVIGGELNIKLEKTLRSLLVHILACYHERAPYYPLMVKLAAVVMMGGKLLEDDSLEFQGTSLFNDLSSQPMNAYWCCPKSLGMILTGISMSSHHFHGGPWEKFWVHLKSTWHLETCCFIGPGLKECQYKFEPAVTLYDLFMSYYSGKLSNRAAREQLNHLEAALIIPRDDLHSLNDFYPIIEKGNIEKLSYIVFQEKKYAYSLFSKPCIESSLSGYEKMSYPFKLIWGDEKHCHSFVCHANNQSSISFEVKESQVILTFQLEDFTPSDDREKCREIAFSFDLVEDSIFLVDQKQSSTFRLDQVVSIKSGNCLLNMKFELLNGSGTFIGHRMVGNRPSQIAIHGKNRYDAYDGEVFLRTVDRKEPCVIQVIIDVDVLTS